MSQQAVPIKANTYSLSKHKLRHYSNNTVVLWYYLGGEGVRGEGLASSIFIVK
jgi:hypothetical protein